MEQEQQINASTETGTENSTQQDTEKQTGVEVQTGTDTQLEGETKADVNGQTRTETSTDEKPESRIMIPKERFDEVNQKYKELAVQVEEMQKAKEAMEAQLQQMKQASEQTSSSIKETTEKLEGQVKQYENLMNQMLETKLQSIPEEMQELIPEGLNTEQKLAWINKAESKGLFKPKEKVVIGQPLNHSADLEQKERYKKMNPIQLLASYYGERK